MTGLSDIRTTPPVINNIPARGAKKERIKATEVKDEDESISGRKYLQISNYRLVDPEETAAYYHYLKNPLPSCTHFSYYSSDKFIVHRVIRV